MLSPTWSSCRCLPSNEVQAELLLSELTTILSSTPAGRMMGLNERECGQTGVTKIPATLGWTIEAPAATAYAVLPVGVETIRPSPCTDVMWWSLQYISKFVRYEDGPRSTTTSFNTKWRVFSLSRLIKSHWSLLLRVKPARPVKFSTLTIYQKQLEMRVA